MNGCDPDVERALLAEVERHARERGTSVETARTVGWRGCIAEIEVRFADGSSRLLHLNLIDAFGAAALNLVIPSSAPKH
jgi:hypothetical protein